jgi:hypothetical protein
MSIEAMRQALEALKTASSSTQVEQERLLYEAAIKRLRNAIDESETLQTHSEDCWRWHHQCAIAKIERGRTMSKKCRAFSESKLGLEPADNRKAFYAGWDAAIKQAEKPVAWMYHGIRHDDTPHERPSLIWRPEYMDAMSAEKGAKAIPLYTAPPPRQWQGLTKREFLDAVDGLEDLEDCWVAIEARLQEKNG